MASGLWVSTSAKKASRAGRLAWMSENRAIFIYFDFDSRVICRLFYVGDVKELRITIFSFSGRAACLVSAHWTTCWALLSR